MGCRYHLVWERKDLRQAYNLLSDDEIAEKAVEMDRPCALQVAEKARTYQFIGDILDLTRQRVRQLILCMERQSRSVPGKKPRGNALHYKEEIEGALYALAKKEGFCDILVEYMDD